jgi:hypothetical protein
MKRQEIDLLLNALVDELAAVEHDRWAHWQEYMHSKGELHIDGSLTLPSELVQRWQAQIRTRYADLSETEKESDREQVRPYLSIIAAALDERSNPSDR